MLKLIFFNFLTCVFYFLLGYWSLPVSFFNILWPIYCVDLCTNWNLFCTTKLKLSFTDLQTFNITQLGGVFLTYWIYLQCPQVACLYIIYSYKLAFWNLNYKWPWTCEMPYSKKVVCLLFVYIFQLLLSPYIIIKQML